MEQVCVKGHLFLGLPLLSELRPRQTHLGLIWATFGTYDSAAALQKAMWPRCVHELGHTTGQVWTKHSLTSGLMLFTLQSGKTTINLCK